MHTHTHTNKHTCTHMPQTKRHKHTSTHTHTPNTNAPTHAPQFKTQLYNNTHIYSTHTKRHQHMYTLGAKYYIYLWLLAAHSPLNHIKYVQRRLWIHGTTDDFLKPKIQIIKVIVAVATLYTFCLNRYLKATSSFLHSFYPIFVYKVQATKAEGGTIDLVLFIIFLD